MSFYCLYLIINHGDPSYQLYCSLHRHPRGLLHCIYLVLQVCVVSTQLFVKEIDRFHWLIFIILDIQWQSHKYFWYFQITGEDSSEQADSGLGGGGECCIRYHNREAVDHHTIGWSPLCTQTKTTSQPLHHLLDLVTPPVSATPSVKRGLASCLSNFLQPTEEGHCCWLKITI